MGRGGLSDDVEGCGFVVVGWGGCSPLLEAVCALEDELMRISDGLHWERRVNGYVFPLVKGLYIRQQLLHKFISLL
jgi:hypothetical protein